MPRKTSPASTDPNQAMSGNPPELSFELFSRRTDPASLGFAVTSELPDLQDVIGQPRALRALELGSEVGGTGYNIFVLGLPGSGRTTLSQEYLQRKAISESVPDDWCYVQNFENPRLPRALRIPPGRGQELRRTFSTFIQRIRSDLPRAFESDAFTQERDRLVHSMQSVQESEFAALQQKASLSGFLVVRSPYGILLAPASQGKPLPPEELEKLTEEQRLKIKELQAQLEVEIASSLEKLQDLANQTNKALEEISLRTVSFVIDPLLGEIRNSFQDHQPVLDHLEAIKQDILENINRFQPQESPQQTATTFPGTPDWMMRYDVNLLVDNSALTGAPVIVENHPVYSNLVGRIEHEVFMGASRTDFSLIRPGAFHRANGGYLLLPVRDLLNNPYAWDALKHVLRDGCIRISEPASQLGLLGSESLEPEPIPLNIKVVLIGTPMLYYTLLNLDEDFSKLFKVRAEFATEMERTPQAEKEYGLFANSVVLENNLPPFDAGAVAELINHSARLAEDQDRLSTRFGWFADLMRESAYWAAKENGGLTKTPQVTAKAVQRAIAEGVYRSSLANEQTLSAIHDGVLQIEVQGVRMGAINALSVIQMGDFAFGRPSRLTAAVSQGSGGVVDIERQANLGGPIHTKGVLILNGYLTSRYGQSKPLNLSASLTFEQSYSGVDGDSASAAELFVLLSAIGKIPLRQDIAVTGSINQHGQIQAIGGVNEKIEGFFDVCNKAGLSGSQGVLIPDTNRRNLMLREDILEAAKAGKFHIWTMRSAEQGFWLLSGLEPGNLQSDGSYPAGSFNAAISARLDEFAEIQKAKGKSQKKPSEKKNI